MQPLWAFLEESAAYQLDFFDLCEEPRLDNDGVLESQEHDEDIDNNDT